MNFKKVTILQRIYKTAHKNYKTILLLFLPKQQNTTIPMPPSVPPSAYPQ